MKKILASIILSISAVVASANFTPASAVTVGFDAITANNASQVAVAEAQLFRDVTDAGAGNVLFLFSNQGIGATNGSESVINTPPVPLPAALPLLLAALGGLGWIARRQKRSNVMAA
jgi:hypothetical protein